MSSCNFLEVCRDVTKTARKIPQSYYLPQGNHKIFDQGKQYIAGYTNDSEGIVSDYPYIVFGDHTRILKFVTEPCFIGADGVKLLKVYNEDFVPQYVYYALLAQPIENQGYSRHFKFLKELNIVIYTKEKQNAIVSELDKIQSALANKKELLKKLDELVQSKFYEMFGDPVVNDKGWDIKTYGETFTLFAGGTPSKTKNEYWENGTISWIGSNLCQNVILYNNDGKFITDLGLKKSSAKLFPVGTVLIALVGATIGKTALLKFETTTNQNVLGVLDIEQAGYEPLFVFYYTQGLHKFFLEIGDGGFAMASKTFVSKLPIFEVDKDLQQAFAAYVEKVERAKAIVSQEIAHLQELLDSRMDFYFHTKTEM